MSHDGIDRRGFLRCMAWAGTGALYTLEGGIARGQAMEGSNAKASGLSFAQISDSHIGFHKEANMDVIGTLQRAVDKINALPHRPAFLIHTGDISHLSKPEEFDTVDSILKSAKVGRRFFVPGEHDVLDGDGKLYRERYGKETKGDGWFSFQDGGAHFVGLVNVMNLKAGGFGSLGADQLQWLENDLKPLGGSTPVVVFAHAPLWTVYGDWGWGTEDGAQALALLRRFGSVTILNGHIHQNVQKVEGNMVFHTACSTAFPQPKPGEAAGPGPLTVPGDELRRRLGLTEVRFAQTAAPLAIVDTDLSNGVEARIENFAFQPGNLKVRAGTEVTWVNHDDMPHNIMSTSKDWSSPVLDTGEKFSRVFDHAGSYPYYCGLHPKMTGKIVVA